MYRARVIARATSTTALVMSLAFLAVLPACDFSFFGGSERPDDVDTLGPLPPPEYACDRGTREVVDQDRDGRPDGVVHKADGATICRGEDSDRDGRIDRWQKIENGRVVSEARDSDGDGKLEAPKAVAAGE